MKLLNVMLGFSGFILLVYMYSPLWKEGLQPQFSFSHDSNRTDLNQKVDSDLHQKKTELSDIFISVKTTKKYHQNRINILLDTWVDMARNETYFISDAKDEELHQKTNGHLINTNCTAGHTLRSLCCKMNVELDLYLASNKRWFCHFDDDTYVNIPKLVQLLQKYNHTDDWYLGKKSVNYPFKAKNLDPPRNWITFRFGTGGAGICISRSLALKMMPYAAGGKFMTTCTRITYDDDCTIGYIIYKLHGELTEVPQFHAHNEKLDLINFLNIDRQITISYKGHNTVLVPRISGVDDPSRLHAVHCQLFPDLKACTPAT